MLQLYEIFRRLQHLVLLRKVGIQYIAVLLRDGNCRHLPRISHLNHYFNSTRGMLVIGPRPMTIEETYEYGEA